MIGLLKKILSSKILSCVLLICMLTVSMGANVSAANPYTYTVTVHAGKQGHMVNQRDLTVLDSSGRRIEPVVDIKSDSIVIRRLSAGCQVLFDAQGGNSVSLDNSSKYYIRGIRESGRDNGTASVSTSTFTVTEDADYVVAYGIKGNLVAYTVNYQDANGNTLAPSRTYYGNVGDMPVVAYLYLENYRPQAYNLTRTLSDNAAANIFTFVYSRIASGGTGGETQTEVTGTTTTPSPEGTPESPTVTEGAVTPAGGGGIDGAAQGADGGAAGAGGAAAEGAGGADAGAGQEDGEPEELINLDDEEVPLSNVGAEDEEIPLADGSGLVKAFPMVAGILISATAVMVIIAAMVVSKKRKKAGGDSSDGNK